MKKAYLFPGQGSQKTGMGKNHFDAHPEFKALCEQANEALGFSLTDVMFDGPDEKLRQTEYTQPAIFLHSVALFATLKQQAGMVAGHSLGEFSALTAAGALSFDDAIRIVRKRGELMQAAGEANPGAMAAVIGMADQDVEETCKEASEQSGKAVVAANYNASGQLVISGYEEAVDVAITLLKAKGCKLAKKLPVSGAFHSPLMQPALDGLRESLEAVTISEPKCPVYANFTAQATTHPDEIRSNLLEQLLNPVRWTQTLEHMQHDGARYFIEVGPGNVLQGLVKRTLKDVQIFGYQ